MPTAQGSSSTNNGQPGAQLIQYSGVPIPTAINRLQAGNEEGIGMRDRKFTPMDVDIRSRPASRNAESLNERGKVVIGCSEGEGGFYCKPGDEDCG